VQPPFYLNLKKTKFAKRKEKIKGSTELRIGDDTITDIIATKIPKNICRVWLFGVVIGSGSITIEKKRMVGSVIKLRVDS